MDLEKLQALGLRTVEDLLAYCNSEGISAVALLSPPALPPVASTHPV